jgi:tRNA/rRNA methyltransferase
MEPTWILHDTSHAGNVGSAARALKTMGFYQLTLVTPRNPDVLLSEEAIALASGADDVLQKTRLADTLDQVCGPLSLVFGLSSRDREFGPPVIPLDEACSLAKNALDQNLECAFLFGTERTGLSNHDYNYCSHRVWIDANPIYPSLNLAQAVMVCAYEMRQTLAKQPNPDTIISPKSPDHLANIAEINALMEHLQQGLETIDFLDPAHPKKLMERLRSLFDRAGLREEEVQLLRGIAKQMILSKDKRFKL